LAQAAGQRHTFSQPYDAREGVDDPEAVTGRACDEQAAIIGTEIERGIRRPAPITGRYGLGPLRRPPTPSGTRNRRPIESGVEAWKPSGLAAHRFLNLPAAPSAADPGARHCSFVVKSLTASPRDATLARAAHSCASGQRALSQRFHHRLRTMI